MFYTGSVQISLTKLGTKSEAEERINYDYRKNIFKKQRIV